MRKLWLASIVIGVSAFAVAPGCGGSNNGSGFDAGGGGNNNSPDGSPDFFGEGGLLGLSDGSFPTSDGVPGVCENLQCQQHTCGTTNGGSTTITGTVYDPAGKNPLYDVVVYVPNATPDPITPGIPPGATSGSCSCDSLYTGQPIASALTGADGKFTLTNAPDGTDIPLVVQIGKWRTQLKIPTVTKCAANDLDTLLPSKLTLPSKAGVSTTGVTKGLEQDIPNIAVSTGGADSLECLLLRAGVDQSEYVGGSGAGHIHIYQGCDGQSCGATGNVGPAPNTSPAGPASDKKLWDSPADIDQYDIVLLSCEGTGTTNPNSQILYDYVDEGGRVFAEHWHLTWFSTILGTAVAPFPSDLASWDVLNDGSYSGAINTTIVQTLPGGQPFPKGEALYEWLGNVGALTGNVDAGAGELSITVARGDATITAANPKSQAWIQTDPSVSPASTQYFSFDMPFSPTTNDAGIPNYCGRVVFSDLHIGAAANDYAGATANPSGHTNQLTTPTGCTTGDLSPDEKALEFMLFDLSSCVTPVTVTPQPPIPTPPIK
jgi:hypothetical protein